jgi:hypothetical protein
MHKLTEETAGTCAGQLLQTLERIQANHGWSNGDLIAVAMLITTELVARAVGPVRTAEFFRAHGEQLAAAHLRRSTN